MNETIHIADTSPNALKTKSAFTTAPLLHAALVYSVPVSSAGARLEFAGNGI